MPSSPPTGAPSRTAPPAPARPLHCPTTHPVLRGTCALTATLSQGCPIGCDTSPSPPPSPPPSASPSPPPPSASPSPPPPSASPSPPPPIAKQEYIVENPLVFSDEPTPADLVAMKSSLLETFTDALDLPETGTVVLELVEKSTFKFAFDLSNMADPCSPPTSRRRSPPRWTSPRRTSRCPTPRGPSISPGCSKGDGKDSGKDAGDDADCESQCPNGHAQAGVCEGPRRRRQDRVRRLRGVRVRISRAGTPAGGARRRRRISM